jgi:hypothetical protein
MLLDRADRAVVVVALCSLGLAAVAQEPPAMKESGWQKLFRRQAGEYKLEIVGDEKAEAKLLAEPILHWSQPVRGGDDGAVFLWTLEGRPAAIGALFVWPMANGQQGVSHELHSFSPPEFVATWKSRKWTPPKDSIVWQALPSAGVPAKTADQRLRQLRQAARAFQAESHDKDDRTWELRLLPQPIYRYAIADPPAGSPGPEILDGALFGFVEGTDLEIVLLMQARQMAAGPQWEFGLARMSDFELKVKLADKTVWELGRARFDDSHGAYFAGTVESRKSADDEK